MAAVRVDKEKCNFSNACLRVCPTYAFDINASKGFVQVNPPRCISCGHCVDACPNNAISFTDYKTNVSTILKSKQKSIAILDPAIPAEFPDITDYRKLAGMIRQLGFTHVIESAFVVDLLAERYNKLLNNFQGKYYIFSNCPAIINLVRKFYPALSGNLAPIYPPHVASAIFAREVFGSDINVTWIGPCIAAKDITSDEMLGIAPDFVLTFKEIRQLFKEKSVNENSLEFDDFDPPVGELGALLPLPSGFLHAAKLNTHFLEGRIITASGRENVLEALDTFESGAEQLRHHLNLYYCDGCIMGPGMSMQGSRFLRQTLIKDYVNKRLQNAGENNSAKKTTVYSSLNLSTAYSADNQKLPDPPEERILEVLKIIGKENIGNTPGCRACGYGSCRDLAKAVAQGIAKPELCMNFSIRSKQEYIKTLKQANEKLIKTQEKLTASEKEAHSRLSDANEIAETATAMFQRLNVAIVIADDKMRIVKSNKWFIQMLGEEAASIAEVIPGLKGADLRTLLPAPFHNLLTYALSGEGEILNRDIQTDERLFNVSIFPIKENKLVGAIIRDMRTPEVMREEVVRRITEVIDTNLELVQKIAFLLGESASSTERMLNSIIETHKPNKS